MTSAAEMLAAQLTAANRRIEAMQAVVDAAKAARPWPKVDYNPTLRETRCIHCQRFVTSQPQYVIEHAESCPGIALRDALAALDAYLGQADGSARC